MSEHAQAFSGLSIIIPVYNGAARLPGLLKSIRSQRFDQNAIEILVVDDSSTDRTVDVAQNFGCRVLSHSSKSPEAGKAVGLKAASNDLVLFIDDDNRLPHELWLSDIIEAFLACPEAVGAQAAYFTHVPQDTLVNRWCAIYGVGDPTAFYLRRQDHLAYWDAQWTLSGAVQRETDKYWLVKFDPSTFPTLGSQGFLTRRSLQLTTLRSPFWLHIDANYELTLRGLDTFVFMKDSVVHEYCDSPARLFAKLQRNAKFFFSNVSPRTYPWEHSRAKTVKALLQMITIVSPLYSSFWAFAKTGDKAALYHPFFCLAVPMLYAYEFANAKLRSRLKA